MQPYEDDDATETSQGLTPAIEPLEASADDAMWLIERERSDLRRPTSALSTLALQIALLFFFDLWGFVEKLPV